MATFVSKAALVGWLNLDAWSEAYVGAHWLVTNELPTNQYEAMPHHSALSQMVLLTSHHLVEVMFFQCVRSILSARPGDFPEIEKEYKKAHFFVAMTQWPEELVGVPLDVEHEPITSVIRLNTRRSATIHKDSALTSLEMARSALYSATQASRTIAEHLLGRGGFGYEQVLTKYPLQEEQWFSEIQLVDAVM